MFKQLFYLLLIFIALSASYCSFELKDSNHLGMSYGQFVNLYIGRDIGNIYEETEYSKYLRNNYLWLPYTRAVYIRDKVDDLAATIIYLFGEKGLFMINYQIICSQEEYQSIRDQCYSSYGKPTTEEYYAREQTADQIWVWEENKILMNYSVHVYNKTQKGKDEYMSNTYRRLLNIYDNDKKKTDRLWSELITQGVIDEYGAYRADQEAKLNKVFVTLGVDSSKINLLVKMLEKQKIGELNIIFVNENILGLKL